jgi:hypothetical protein
MCASVGPPAWVVSVDPMLEELATSLVVSQPARTPAPGCLPTQAATLQKVEAPLGGTRSPATAAQWTTKSPFIVTGAGAPIAHTTMDRTTRREHGGHAHP